MRQAEGALSARRNLYVDSVVNCSVNVGGMYESDESDEQGTLVLREIGSGF